MFDEKTMRIETRWNDSPHVTITEYRSVSVFAEPLTWFRLHRSGQFERELYLPPGGGRQVLTWLKVIVYPDGEVRNVR